MADDHTFQAISAHNSDSKHRSNTVLPFINMSNDPEQEYFSDGFTEEIINALSHIKSLKVIARAPAFAFKRKQEDLREMGKKLNVECCSRVAFGNLGTIRALLLS